MKPICKVFHIEFKKPVEVEGVPKNNFNFGSKGAKGAKGAKGELYAVKHISRIITDQYNPYVCNGKT